MTHPASKDECWLSRREFVEVARGVCERKGATPLVPVQSAAIDAMCAGGTEGQPGSDDVEGEERSAASGPERAQLDGSLKKRKTGGTKTGGRRVAIK